MRDGGSLVNGLDVLGLERRTADDEGVQDDADGPSVDFEAVTVCGVKEDFWSDIVWSSANSFFALSGTFDEGSEAKVADFDVHVVIEEEVSEFEVAVDDLVRVHVVTGADELYHEVTGFAFSETAATTEHVHEGTASAELECHVDVFVVLEAFLEGDDVGVFE